MMVCMLCNSFITFIIASRTSCVGQPVYTTARERRSSRRWWHCPLWDIHILHQPFSLRPYILPHGQQSISITVVILTQFRNVKNNNRIILLSTDS